MQLTQETLKQDLEHLNRHQLQQVADFIAFLKFRDRTIEPHQFAAIAEFAEDDRAMAEAGMDDYATSLAQEDES
jgi:uncharacterized protein YciI